MRKRSPKIVEGQEQLFAFDEGRRSWETRGIFSEHYLQTRLRNSSYWSKDDYTRPIFDFISELWKKRYLGLAKGNEETTRREFLEKILQQLGFSFFSNLQLPESERTQTPDYLLFEDEATKDQVFNEDDEVKHQAAIGLMEAKKVNHPLDQVSKKETPGRFPHQQVRDYLSQAINKTGDAYFRWGILSNGNIWRLYCRDAHPSAYFEFHLSGPEEYFCSYEDFKVFITLLTFGTNLTDAVCDAIKEIEAIEEEASTEIDIVKKKEERWRDKVVKRLDPFRDVANLWITAASGLEINESEYTLLASGFVALPKPRSKELRAFKSMLEKFQHDYRRITNSLMPFHWELEFPDVFFHDDGTIKENPGFDAILGNPPYISTQTSSGFEYRNALNQRFGFVDDLYVHFVSQGFNLLRNGGMFGYIVSDTFFTLATKLRMRELLQRNRLYYVGQCDPFAATVDAAIFIAEKQSAKGNYGLHFIQARYDKEGSTPDKELLELAMKPILPLINGAVPIQVAGEKHNVLHGTQGCLRLHRIGVDAYRSAVSQVFFEPTEAIVQLYNKFNDPLNKLISKWWKKIETSKKFEEYKTEIIKYYDSLKAGDITLLGLIAEGGQGLATANNGRFLGYLEGTEQAEKIKIRQNELKQLWKQNNRIAPVFHKLLDEKDSNFEDVIEELKKQFDQYRALELRKGEIYRTVPVKLIATDEDFKSAFCFRKAELEEQWKESKDFKSTYKELKQQHGEDFCKLFQAIVNIAIKRKISLTKLGIRPGEFYDNEEEAPRVATIHNGLVGKRYWVSFRKGDPVGNKWSNIEPLFILWSKDNADYIRTSKDARWQGYQYFLKEHGIAWTRGANHTCIKARLQSDCIYDVGGMQISAMKTSNLSDLSLLSIFNSNIFSFILKKFIAHTWMVQINDIRQMPIVIPTKDQAITLETLANRAVEAKELTLRKQDPSVELIEYSRQLVKEQQHAPKYLQPRPQLLLLDSSEECLHAIELAVQWGVEKLYGVEGMGPSEEF